MREYKRFVLLVLIMAGVALTVGATAIGILYRTAVEQQRLRLIETAQSQARLMEAVARFDRANSAFPDTASAMAATLSQIRDAHENFRHTGLGSTGEFTLARRRGDSIVFMLSHRHSALDEPAPVAFASDLAEPMRRALNGLSGTLVGLDYRGATVLAAHEPVDILKLGIVAKIDLAEIQAPFISAGAIVFGIALLVITGGTLLFVTVSEPIMRRIGESEARFRELFENMSSGAAVYEAVDGGSNFVVRDFNQAGERIDGMSRTELIGRRVTDMVPGIEELGLLDVLKRVWQSGRPERHPIKMFDDDRIQGWLENYVYKLPSGEVVAVYDDVTEQKKADEALHRSEARLRALLDASQEHILLTSTKGAILTINSAAQRDLAPGRDVDDLVGQSLHNVLPQALADARMAAIERVEGTQEPVHSEDALNGRWFDAWAYPVIGPRGRVTEVALYAHDITRRKEADAERRRLTLAVEQSPDSVIITDPEGRIEYVNPKFTDATGYGAHEVVGKTPRILKSGHTPPEEYTRLWRTITSGQIWRGEFQNKKKSGELFWELASIAPVKDADGAIINFVAVKEDITGRKATEEQLRQSQKMEAVGQLTGGIAHDFNNLLAIIIGNLQLLRDRVPMPDKSGELLADALWSAQRGADLTHRLLAFARRQPLSPEVIRVNDVVSGMTDLLRRTIGAGVRVEENLAGDLWDAFADRGELERALVNLAVNARDAMRAGGVLTIHTENIFLDRDFAAQHGEVEPGDYVTLALTDTGIGMSQETMDRIFEPFFTTKKLGEGSGLGLSMVYGFVRQSGGHVGVESRLGRGTTVTLYLPRAVSGAGAPKASQTPAVARSVAGKVVLVVEDEARLRKVAVKMLENLGLRVVSAEDAHEALARLDEHPEVDLLFTDLELPGGMNGVELVDAVRQRHPDIRILFTTGYARDAFRSDRPSAAGIPLIGKPYSQADLARHIDDVLTAPAR